MPPTPVDPENVLLDPSALPRFHLRCLDLNHPGASSLAPTRTAPSPADHVPTGTEVFFDLTSSPSVVLAVPASRVLHLLYPPESSESLSTGPPAVRSITLHLHAFDGVAYTCGSELDNEHKELHLSLSYVEGVAQRSTDTGHRRVGDEIEGVLTHELVHAFQYNGRGTVPGGVIEGIADWVRYQAGFAPPHWREEPREGDRWDAGYERTVRARALSRPLWASLTSRTRARAGLLPRFPLAPPRRPSPRAAAQRRLARLGVGRWRASEGAPWRQGRRGAVGDVLSEREEGGGGGRSGGAGARADAWPAGGLRRAVLAGVDEGLRPVNREAGRARVGRARQSPSATVSERWRSR